MAIAKVSDSPGVSKSEIDAKLLVVSKLAAQFAVQVRGKSWRRMAPRLSAEQKQVVHPINIEWIPILPACRRGAIKHWPRPGLVR